MTRNIRGVAAALLCAWFNVPLAVFGGLLGAGFGGVAGFGGGAVGAAQIPLLGDAIPTGMFQTGGMTGAVAGVIVGAVAGFLAGLLGPWILLAVDDAGTAVATAVGQVVAGAFLGVLYTLYSVMAEGLRLRMAGARRLSRREAELLMPIMHECAQRLELQGLPELLIDDTRAINAYAATRHIVLTQGLLDEFNYDREVVAAVISHELGHWNNADPVANAFVRGVALPLYVVYTITACLLQVLRHPVVQLIVWLALWPILITVRYIVTPAQAADSQDAEYRADRVAVLAGHREGIRRFLTRTRRTIDGGQTGWDETICGTHPPTELRLEALEERGKTYRLPDEDAPVQPLPVAIASGLQRD